MHEQSHDGGALFEFELQQRTDREIEVKHRGTGHVYRFLISEDGSSLQNEHTIVPNPSSTIDAAMFSTPARRAALRYISERWSGRGAPLCIEKGSVLAGGEPARVSKLDDVAYMTALQAELRRSTRNELVSLFQEATKRRAAGETLASIAKSLAVDISMISRL